MKILFIQTGGTIDKDYREKVKSYHFSIGKPAVKNVLKKIRENFNYRIISLMRKDSLDITDLDRKKICDVCLSSSEDKIIITHGTDTMVHTAEVLGPIIKNKVVILTGSLLPEKFYDSEADFNIGTAIGALNVLKSGVYIAMNGRIYDWDNCQKHQRTGQFIEKS